MDAEDMAYLLSMKKDERDYELIKELTETAGKIFDYHFEDYITM
jgi:hypothetical protein